MIGATVNLGDYQSLKIDCGISADRKLTPEEVGTAKEIVQQLFRISEKQVNKKAKQVKAEIGGTLKITASVRRK